MQIPVNSTAACIPSTSVLLVVSKFRPRKRGGGEEGGEQWKCGQKWNGRAVFWSFFFSPSKGEKNGEEGSGTHL